MTKTYSATKARKNFFQLLREAALPGSVIRIILQDEQPVIMMAEEEWEGWMETLEIMSDPQIIQELREAQEEVKRGEGIPWEEVKKELEL